MHSSTWELSLLSLTVNFIYERVYIVGVHETLHVTNVRKDVNDGEEFSSNIETISLCSIGDFEQLNMYSVHLKVIVRTKRSKIRFQLFWSTLLRF